MTADQLAMLQEQGKTPENLPRYKHLPGERSMRAAELYAAVMRLTEVRELWVMHVPASATLARGWPDLTILGPRGCIFRKLLDEHGMLHPNSATVLNRLRRSGINADVWRPAQLHDGTIEAELEMVDCVRPRVYQLRCEECTEPFEWRAPDRRWCSSRCRMRRARRLKKQKLKAASQA